MLLYPNNLEEGPGDVRLAAVDLNAGKDIILEFLRWLRGQPEVPMAGSYGRGQIIDLCAWDDDQSRFREDALIPTNEEILAAYLATFDEEAE